MTHQLSPKKIALVAALHVIVIAITIFFRGCSHYNPNENALEMVPLGTDNPGEGMPVKDSAAGEQAAPGPEAPAPQPHSPQPSTPPPTPAQPTQKIPEPEPEPQPAKEEPKDPTPSPIPEPPKPPVKKVEKKTPPKPEQKKEPKEEPKKTEPQKTPSNNEKKSPATSTIKVDLTKKVVRSTGSTPPSAPPADGKTGGGGKGKIGSTGISKSDIEGAGISAGTLKDSLVKSLQAPGVRGGTGVGQLGSPDGKNSEIARYNLLIKETIERNWRKPNLPGIAQLETTVLIRIAPDGSLTFITTRRPSGNSDMDDSVETAIRSTSRIPERLPDGMGNPNYDVSINFRLR